MIYNKQYITNVILRIDFVSDIDQLKNELLPNVKTVCVKYFPIAEARNVETQEVIVTNNPTGQNTVISKEKMLEWHFFGKEKEKELVITAKSMFVDFKVYKSFDEFKTQFFTVFSELQKVYPQIKINRIGLRYIDQIDLMNEKLQNKTWFSFWNKYIDSHLIQGLAFADQNAALARHMNSIEMNYGDHMLRFQYGIHNQDYPASIKKQIFILDTDVYSVGLFSLEEVEDIVDVYHKRAKEWFEKSIKDSLRSKMGVIEQDA